MIPFNEYQQWKRTENLALECFNKLYDIGINPESYVQWIYSENFDVNENQIAKYINKSYLFESFGEMMPKPSPSPTPTATPPPLPTPTATPTATPPPTNPKELSALQYAMKDPTKQAMLQRSLVALKKFQQSFLTSLKRGGILGKQVDLNKLLGDTINAVQSLNPRSPKPSSAPNPVPPPVPNPVPPPLPKPNPVPPPVPKPDPDYTAPDRFSDHYELSRNKRLLKEWKKTESILKGYNIDVKTFLKNVKNVGDLDEGLAVTLDGLDEGLATNLDAIGSGAMGAIGGLFSGGFKGMVKGAKERYNSSLDKAETDIAQDVKNNLDDLINALPDKNSKIVKMLQSFNQKIEPIVNPNSSMAQAEEPKGGEQQQQAGTAGTAGTVEKVHNELLKAFELIKADPKKDPIIPSIKDNAMKDEIVKMLKFSVPLQDGSSVKDAGVEYTFKNNKWYTLPPKQNTEPDSAGKYDPRKNVADHYEPSRNKRLFKEFDLPGYTSQEVDPKIQAELNAKYPAAGKPNVLLDVLKKLMKAEKVGNLANAIGDLQKETSIPEKLRNYLVNLLQGKNESVYFTMDYSEFVSDLTNR
jgi:hypothetical protein